MSVDGETSRVMKGVQHGACDYLLKPIRMKELRNIWQHVLRKKMHDGRDTDSLEVIDGLQLQMAGSRSDHHFFSGEDIWAGKKRKEAEAKHDDKWFTDLGSTTKKARVAWSVDLHQKFVQAVNQIGFEKVGPKRILDLMNIPWLTRENVASHLQKYRLYLSRLQKDDLKTDFGGMMKHPDTASPDHPLMTGEDISRGNLGFSGNGLSMSANSKGHETHVKGILQGPRVEPKGLFTGENPDKQESMDMKIAIRQSSMPSSGPEEGRIVFDCSVPDHSPQSVNSKLQPAEGGAKFIETTEQPLYADSRCSTHVTVNPMKPQSSNTVGGPGMDNNMSHCQDFQPIPPYPPSMQSQSFGSIFMPQYDSQVGWLQQDLEISELQGHIDPCIVAEGPIHVYDALRFDYEQFVDPYECPIFDHGLFIA
ncbi:hypothetical protein SAY87_016117 [Trapa incisa]|uniref:Response regulatory domain-containing protein n=1 Tax=Trapa incisa TaxID=236973 RepID=A0AAN7L693_9MYRT|nr:hypothetical protein SAY87_016117 [Trapa incisa]